jgi:hypothetical protein
MVVLLLPLVLAGIAQALTIRFDILPRLAVPIDGNATLHGKPLFGPNKTWRGVLVMTTSTTIAAALLFQAFPPIAREPAIGWAGLGAAMGLGYVVAELPNSYVKRRLGIGAGKRSSRLSSIQYLVDQMDSVIGVAIVLWLFADIEFRDMAVLIVAGTALHIVFDVGLHALGVKSKHDPIPM